jgi:hypothetical protein
MAKANDDNPLMWILGGLAALLGVAGLAAMNKPAGGSTTPTTMTDTPKPKSGCGCNAHS